MEVNYMKHTIDGLHIQIGNNFDNIIPSSYSKAWIYFSSGKDVVTTFWFCYKDKKSQNIIPMDRICDRKDIIVGNVNEFKRLRSVIVGDLLDLQELYLRELNQVWYELTYELDEDGTFKISFDYEKPQGSLESRREKWCISHLGFVPVVSTKDLRR